MYIIYIYHYKYTYITISNCIHIIMGQNPSTLVHTKIAGKWGFLLPKYGVVPCSDLSPYIQNYVVPCPQEISRKYQIKNSYGIRSLKPNSSIDTHTSCQEQPPEAMVTCRPSCWYLRVTLAGRGEEALRIGNGIKWVLTILLKHPPSSSSSSECRCPRSNASLAGWNTARAFPQQSHLEMRMWSWTNVPSKFTVFVAKV